MLINFLVQLCNFEVYISGKVLKDLKERI